MKALISLLFYGCVLSISLHAQFLPFKASSGQNAALNASKKAGLANAKLTSIATLGDTTFFGSYLDPQVKSIVKFSFDPANGKSTFWGYRSHDIVNAKDTSDAQVVLNVIINYQAIAVPLPDIPSLPIRLDSALPATYMDSDVMATKVSANPQYKSYMQDHPNAKYQAVSLGMSKGGLVPEGPLWICFIGEKVTENSLQCYVPAGDNNGTAVCMQIAGSDVHDAELNDDALRVVPSPARRDRARLHIPLSQYRAAFDLEIVDVFGAVRHQRHIDGIGGGVDLELDLSACNPGVYFARVGTQGNYRVLSFVVEP